MYPRLGIAARRETMTGCQKLSSQLGILEKLAVERNPDRTIFVSDRLLAPCQVDDRQPPGPDCQTGLEMKVLVVGAPVRDRPGHRQQTLGRKLPSSRQIKCTGDATHGSTSLSESMAIHRAGPGQELMAGI